MPDHRTEIEKRAEQRFADDITTHTAKILLDDGIYRHVQCRRPETGMYWFEVLTWPGALCIRGDMGTFVFSRVHDMFEFFRGQRINPQYWAEKEISGAPTRTYSVERVKQHIKEATDKEALEWRDFTPAERREIRRAADALVRNEDLAYREGARYLLDEFHVELSPKSFRFSDTWEWDLEEYTIHFLWCLHALVWAIKQYDAAKVPA